MPVLINDILYGDGVGSLTGHEHAGSQTFAPSNNADTIVGDVDALLGHSTGAATSYPDGLLCISLPSAMPSRLAITPKEATIRWISMAPFSEPCLAMLKP
jgi:hypothetical protein